jgi:peroxiredoxin
MAFTRRAKERTDVANVLTGDFDVVIEMSTPRVNRILAAQHQAGSHPHSFTLQIEDVAPGAKSGTSPFDMEHVSPAPRSAFRQEMVAQVPSGDPSHDLPTRAVPSETAVVTEAHAMPRVSSTNYSNYSMLLNFHPDAFVHPAAAGIDLVQWKYTGVRGTAAIQVSTPTLKLPSDPMATHVTLHYEIMAHMATEPGSALIPEFIHGGIDVTVDAAQIAWQSGNSLDVDFSVLNLDFQSPDVTISFTPAPQPSTGAQVVTQYTPRDVAQIELLIRNVLSTAFGSTSIAVSLPPAVHDLHFKTVPLGAPSTLALLLNLSEHASTRNSANTVFTQDGDVFAIAIGLDYVSALVSQQVATSFAAPIVLHEDAFFCTIYYSVTLAGVSVQLQPGQVGLIITANAQRTSTCGWPLPDFTVTATQWLAISLNNGQITLGPQGDPTVTQNGIPGFVFDAFKQTVLNQIKQVRDTLLPGVNAVVRQQLAGIDFGSILSGLHVPQAQAAFDALEVRTDGLVLHGTLDLGPWKGAVATNQGAPIQRNGQSVTLLDAFESWIPGGTVESYTWATQDATQQPITETDRFMTFVPPDGISGPTQWCVKVSGTQSTSTGATQHVEHWSCALISPVLGVLRSTSAPRLAGRFVIPIPGPGPDPDAYLDPWAGGAVAVSSGANLLIHFADVHSAESLSLVGEALAASSADGSALYAIAVLPHGQIRTMTPPLGRANLMYSLTEDFEGSWRRTFGVTDAPATILLNGYGQTRWHHNGPLDRETLIQAFRAYLSAGSPLTYQPLRLVLREGMQAPDFSIELAHGQRLPLRELHGRRVLLTFWTTWAEPCLREFQQLERSHRGAGREAPIILAINDGEPAEVAARFLKEHHLTAMLVADADRKISRRYGVHCWPTTIALDEQGRIVSTQMGISRGSGFFSLRAAIS